MLAGPGSGKTLTIVGRVKYLIEEAKVRPEEILVVTFTKYAAGEMKSRLCSSFGKRSVPVTVGTFHGIFFGILCWAYQINGQNILSEKEKNQLLRGAVSEQGLELFDEEDFIQEIASEIGKIKNHRLNVNDFVSSRCRTEVFQRIYASYESHRKQLRKLDFDDILVVCFTLLATHPDVLSQWQKKFRYILIDEFQDINRIQYDVIRMLAMPEKNLFVVGDDDQAIYGFRGADSSLMLGFEKDYPEARRILLDTNYRSTEQIVSNSLRMIEKNKSRFPKQIRTVRGKGQSVHIQEVEDPGEEASYVAEEITKRLGQGVLAEEIGVLFRLHTDARPVIEALIRENIPFQVKDPLPDLYQHFVAKDVMAYLRLAAGMFQRRDFLQVMNRPVRYLSRDCLSAEGSFEEMRTFYCDKSWMLDRIDEFELDLKVMGRMTPYGAIQYLRKKIGYDEYLKQYAEDHRLDPAQLFEVVAALEESARPVREIKAWLLQVESFSEELRRKEAQRRGRSSGEGVRLMTIHSAKGLEFDTVFLLQAAEDTIPYKKAVGREGLEEERRLFYVAMTRAKNVLRICYPRTKNGKACDPSRFVEELLTDPPARPGQCPNPVLPSTD